MAEGTECDPIEFDLEPIISFNAKDVIRSLSAVQVVQLIKELDVELNEWEATVYLASYFGGQLKDAPAETVAMNDAQLLEELGTLSDGEEA